MGVHDPTNPSSSARPRNPPAPATMDSFLEHQKWLASMRKMHQTLMEEDDARSSPSGRTAPLPNTGTSMHGATSPLPEAPMMWGRPEEVNDESFAFNSMAMDDSFDAPVYRSIGSIFDNVEFVDDNTAWEEPPVYRSIGLAFDEEGGAGGVASERHDSVSEDWLATMPPLLCRQRGGVLA